MMGDSSIALLKPKNPEYSTGSTGTRYVPPRTESGNARFKKGFPAFSRTHTCCLVHFGANSYEAVGHALPHSIPLGHHPCQLVGRSQAAPAEF